MKTLLLSILGVWLCAACVPAPPPPKITVSVVADGLNRNYEYAEPVTVAEFLREIDLQLGELDDVNPPLYTQISDSLVITIVRITEETYSEDRDIPYEVRRVISETVPQDSAGELVQAGENGVERLRFRVQIRDGVRQQPQPSGEPVILSLPKEEILYVPPPTTLDPVEVVGTLAYLSRGNAWVMRGSNQLPNRRPFTNTGDLDGRVFSLSPDSSQLLFTRKTTPDSNSFGNQLWLLTDLNADPPTLLQLRPENVLYADWLPGVSNTITYSRAEPRNTPPGWDARNDLWVSVIDPQTGEEISIDPVVEEYSGDLYGWWGTSYAWSPDGQRLAYAHANAVGVVDLETGERTPLLRYEVFTPRSDWSWRAPIAWSPDSAAIVTTVHGAPIGAESPERSPVFNIAFAAADGIFSTDIVTRAGIWSNPQFSPFIASNQTEFPNAYLGYLLARQPLESLSDTAEYDLWVADRDGSNGRQVFPEDGQPGILSRDYAWGPTGQQLVVVYQGNLYLVEVAAGVTRQLTLDGSAEQPVWTR
ncbi:MAG: DPP IV N-terminal domain-containing protein [Armatimonadetes bacterium]|nr:DPP IV N-terminal domain-containing protein [Anaerolineae bacterium]